MSSLLQQAGVTELYRTVVKWQQQLQQYCAAHVVTNAAVTLQRWYTVLLLQFAALHDLQVLEQKSNERSCADAYWLLYKLEEAAQVEVQEAYGKQTSQRYPLDPPDPKALVGEDASTHNRGMGGPLPKLPLSVQPGEVHVQVWTLSAHLHHLLSLLSC